MIKKDSSTGVTSIGENSLNLKETTTEQQLWGTNADGKVVPINITNGSKLLINGVMIFYLKGYFITINRLFLP